MRMRARCPIAFLAFSLVASAAAAQPRTVLGRVFSLHPTVVDQQPSGAGQDVEIGVDLTLVFRLKYAARYDGGSDAGRLAMAAGVEDVAQPLTITGATDPGVLGGPFTASTTVTTPFVPTSFFSTAAFFSPLPSPSSGSSHFTRYLGLTGTGEDRRHFRVHADGNIPGIDWGDGSTVPVTLIPGPALSTTTTPTNGAVFRHWRGTFSHSYADQAPRTIRVASGCCADTYSLGSGNPVSGFGSFSISYSLVRDLSSMYATKVVTGYVTTNGFGTHTFTNTPESPLHLTRSEVLSSSKLVYEGIVQLTDTLELPALELSTIPTASGLGLAFLAVALLGVGTFLLRRG